MAYTITTGWSGLREFLRVHGVKGSLFLMRPGLNQYIATREELLMRARDLFGWLASGAVKIHINHTFPLADAVKAHQELEARRTTGKVLLEVGGS